MMVYNYLSLYGFADFDSLFLCKMGGETIDFFVGVATATGFLHIVEYGGDDVINGAVYALGFLAEKRVLGFSLLQIVLDDFFEVFRSFHCSEI